MLPGLWLLRLSVVAIDLIGAGAVIASDALYMGALFFYRQALQEGETSIVARSSKPLHCVVTFSAQRRAPR